MAVQTHFSQHINPEKRAPRVLRLALAMRGGVSLAVWIGGAVAELDLFRRASLVPIPPSGQVCAISDEDWAEVGVGEGQIERARKYRELLGDQYSKVEIDILAGASAGGLNSVLMAVAMSTGRVMDGFAHSTWINDGALWGLLRDPGFRRVGSLLDGDGVFLPAAGETLRRIAVTDDGCGHKAVVNNISVDLSATLLGGGDSGSDHSVREHAHRSGFTFARRPGGLGTGFSTIPQRGEVTRDGDVNRPECSEGVDGDNGDRALGVLARAVRSTSSYPGAFEPSTIISRPDGGPSSACENAIRAFPLVSERMEGGGYSPDHWRVVDGGIFDNIPIDRAIRAIQRAPASGPTERRLVYLDPSPPRNPRNAGLVAAATPRRTANRSAAPMSHVVEVVLKSLRLKIREEAAHDELAALRHHNDAVLARRGRLEILAGTLNESSDRTPGAEMPALVTAERYKERRLAEDCRRLTTVLSAPWSETCVPPFPTIPLHPLNAEAGLKLKEGLREVYSLPQAEGAVDGDVQAIIEAVDILVLWVHAIEDCGDRARVPDKVAALKARLYRFLAIAIEARRVAVYRPLARDVDRDGNLRNLEDSVRRTWYAQSTLRFPVNLRFLSTMPEPAFYRRLGAWVSAHLESPLTGVDSAEPETSPGVGLVVAMWDSLDRELALLRQLKPETWTSDADRLQTWNETVFHGFSRLGYASWSVRDVIRLVAVAGGAGDSSMIRFHTITGDERPEVLEDDLRAAVIRASLARWLRAPDLLTRKNFRAEVSEVVEQTQRTNGAAAKLAGTAIANFGGFLDWRWRANDWRWGRMDAAAGIVRLFTESPDPASASPTSEGCPKIHGLQKDILGRSEEFLKDGGGWTQPSHEHSAADLSPRYRLAVGSRIGTISCRALRPTKRGPLSVIGAGQRVGLVALKFALVPALLVLDPLRLVTVAAAILGGITALRVVSDGALGTSCGTGMEWVLLGISALLAVVGVSNALATERRHRTVGRALAEGDRAWRSGDSNDTTDSSFAPWQVALRGVRFWRVCLWLVVALQVVITLLLATWIFDKNPLPEVVIAVLATGGGAIFVLTSRSRTAKPLKRKSAGDSRRIIGRWLGPLSVIVSVAALMAGAQYVATTATWNGIDSLALSVAIAAVVALILGVASVWGWTTKLNSFLAVAVIAAGSAVLVLVAEMCLGWDLGLWVGVAPVVVWVPILGLTLGVLRVRTEGYGEEPIVAPST